MPDDLKQELVATYCRCALEAAAQAKIRGVRLGRGDAYAEVENALAKARTLRQTMALAIFDVPGREGDLMGHLNSHGSWAADTARMCAEGAHGTAVGDLPRLISDTKRLADWLRA
jgi:hypothetical protein